MIPYRIYYLKTADMLPVVYSPWFYSSWSQVSIRNERDKRDRYPVVAFDPRDWETSPTSVSLLSSLRQQIIECHSICKELTRG